MTVETPAIGQDGRRTATKAGVFPFLREIDSPHLPWPIRPKRSGMMSSASSICVRP